MATRITVREYKSRASAIVGEVRERKADEDEVLAEVDRIAERIARAWRSPKGALELLEEQRR